MKVVIASDHRGFRLKKELISYLRDKAYTVIDSGPEDENSVDYPIYVKKAIDNMQDKTQDRTILICGSGFGVCIAANKFNDIRAATVREEQAASMAVLHDNINVLCLGADYTDTETAKIIADAFLSAEFEGGRHKRRIDMISGFEKI